MADTEERTPMEVMRNLVRDCSVEYSETDQCPECGSRHAVIDSLPDRPLHAQDMKAIGEGGLPIKPAFRLHMEDASLPFGYAKYAPAVFVLTDGEVKLLNYGPDTGWVVIEEADAGGQPNQATEPLREDYLAEISASHDLPTIDNDPRL